MTASGMRRPSAVRRELLHGDDMADACIHLLQLSDVALQQKIPPARPPLVNAGSGEEQTIAQLA